MAVSDYLYHGSPQQLLTEHWADSTGDAVMMKLGAGPGRVVPVNIAAGGSSPFVLRAGDTMTGNLGIGTGITFPATQSASSNANTLDDYEEGTWTPTLRVNGSATGITYTTQEGYYIKVGKKVWATFYIVLSSKGAGAGNVDISGYPFTCANSSYSQGGSGVVSYFNNMNAALTEWPVLRVEKGTTAGYVWLPTSAASYIATDGHLTNTSNLLCGITYEASA